MYSCVCNDADRRSSTCLLQSRLDDRKHDHLGLIAGVGHADVWRVSPQRRRQRSLAPLQTRLHSDAVLESEGLLAERLQEAGVVPVSTPTAGNPFAANALQSLSKEDLPAAAGPSVTPQAPGTQPNSTTGIDDADAVQHDSMSMAMWCPG